MKAGGARRWGPHTAETKAKVAAGVRRRWTDASYRERIVNSRRGSKLSDETKARMAAARLGHVVLESTREKMRAARRSRRPTGICGICSDSAFLVKDHCHKTGKRRGDLCDRCNMALGLFKDDVEVLRAASAYLEKW